MDHLLSPVLGRPILHFVRRRTSIDDGCPRLLVSTPRRVTTVVAQTPVMMAQGSMDNGFRSSQVIGISSAAQCSKDVFQWL